MPFKHLTIKDEVQGLPRQPVPLRLIPLITDWTMPELLQVLSVRFHDRYVLLTAYEYLNDAPPGEVPINFYREIYENINSEKDGNDQIAIFPSNHFVWSDELATAFSGYIEETIGYEEAKKAGLKLSWNPALNNFAKSIHECPDFHELQPASLKKTTKNEQTKAKTQEMYQRWCKEAERLRSSNPKLKESDIARQIEKLPIANNNGYDHIRKMIRKHCTK